MAVDIVYFLVKFHRQIPDRFHWQVLIIQFVELCSKVGFDDSFSTRIIWRKFNKILTYAPNRFDEKVENFIDIDISLNK